MELALTDEQRLGSAWQTVVSSHPETQSPSQAAALLLQSLGDPEVKDPMLRFNVDAED